MTEHTPPEEEPHEEILEEIAFNQFQHDYPGLWDKMVGLFGECFSEQED